MSGIAATTGPNLPTLASHLEGRGPTRHRLVHPLLSAAALGQSDESIHLSDPAHDCELLISGSIRPSPDILSLIRKDLIAGLQSLRGPGILLFRLGNRLILSRDAAGGRSVNYTWHRSHFSCASTTKALTTLPGQDPHLRPGALAQYLAFSFIPGPETMLTGIFALPAGSYLEIDLTSPAPTAPVRWFHPENAEGTLPENESVPAFSQTLTAAVERLLPEAGSNPALFLSGGLDSSCIAAELARHHTSTLQTYSLFFGEQYPHELEFARQVVKHCGIRNHHEVLIEPRSFLPRLDSMVSALDEPIGDPVTLPNFELARLVSQNHSSVFNGEGGDPLFGGPKNFNLLLHHWYGLPQHRQDPAHREKQYLTSYRRAYEEVDRLLTPEFRELFDPSEALEGPLRTFFRAPTPSTLLNKLMLINQRLKGAQLILPKVERMLAAHQLRPLSPLYDETLIQLSFALPPSCKLKHGQDKLVMKKAFAGRLPDSIIHRPKSGMRVPVHFWMQREMKGVLRDVLAPHQLRRDGIFQPRRVQQLIRYSTEEGPGRHGLRLWMLMTFHLWKKQFKF